MPTFFVFVISPPQISAVTGASKKGVAAAGIGYMYGRKPNWSLWVPVPFLPHALVAAVCAVCTEGQYTEVNPAV